MQKAIVNLMILFIVGLTTNSMLASIECPDATILISNDTDLCSATVTIPLPTPGDCVITSITHNSPFGNAADPSGVYPLGSTEFEYTVNYTDDQGSQTTTCRINVIAEDNQTPMEPTCPAGMTITDCQSAGTAAETIEEFLAQGGALNFENCGYDHSLFESVEDILPISSSSCDFRIRRQYTVYDNYPGINNKVSCTQSILVSDEIKPTISCPEGVTNIACNSNLPSGAEDPVSYIGLGGAISDNCVAIEDLLISYSDNPEAAVGACDVNGDPVTIIRTYEVIDNCGNNATCIQTLTYSVDDVAPVIICPSNVTNLNCNNVLPLAENQLSGTDNCDSATLFSVLEVSDDNMHTTFCEGIVLSRVYTASDACGNEASCTQMFTFVADTVGPSLTCPDDASIVICTELPDAETILNGTDNCDGVLSFAVTSTSTEVPSSSCVDITIIRTYTALDACQNQGTCTQTIRLMPNDESPTFATPAPSPILIACSDDLPEFDQLEAEDNCGNAVEVTLTIDAATELACTDRQFEYTWTATDNCGNTAEVTTTVTREADVNAPFDVVCIPDITVECTTTYPSPITSIEAWLEASGEVTDDCTFGDLTISASDNQDPSAYSYCPDDGSFPITRTYTFTDGCGSSSTCEQTITLLPNSEPFEISCSSERVLAGEQGGCGATLRLDAPVAISSCGALSSTEMMIGGEVIDGMYTFESREPTEVIWRFTDACGTVQECREMIRVEDNVPPSFVCEGGKVISLSNSNVELGIEHFFDANSVTDNCSDSYEVTIRRMTDNCGIDDNLIDGESIEYCCADIGQEVMVLVTVTDSNGNANTCMVSSTVSDKSPPSLICPPDITVRCDTDIDMDQMRTQFGTIATSPEGRQEIIIDDEVVGLDGLVTDLCSSVEIIERVDDTGLTCSTGVVIRSFTAMDAQENGSSCSQVISVVDGDPFDADDIIIPDNIEIDLGCVKTPPTPEELESAPTFTSSTCANVFYTYSDDVFKFPDSGCMHIIRSFSVIDWCQNNDQGFPPLEFGPFTQHITLTNSDAPTITTCESIEFCADASSCVAAVTLPYQGTDLCTLPEDLIWSWSLDVNNDGQDFLTTTGSGTYVNENGQTYDIGDTGTSVVTTLSIGEHAIEWTVEDNCGNTDVCTQMITVRDCKAPTIACLQGIAVSLVDMSPNPPMVELWASDFNASSTDNCTPDDELQFIFLSTGNGNKTFTCQDVGRTDVSIIVIDNDGNQSQCNTYVNVQDTQASSSEAALQVCTGESTDYTLPDGTVVNIGVGTYNYNVSSNVGSCNDVLTVTVTEVADPTVSIESPSDANCNFDLTQYTATPTGGVWTDDTGTQISDLENVTTGIFTYTFTNTTGCTNSQQVTIACCDVNGGAITLSDGSTSANICYVFEVDNDLDIDLTNSVGSVSNWVITDTNGVIVVAPSTTPPTDLEGLSPGTCRIYHVSSQNALTDVEVNDNIADLSGCFSLSNFITLTKDGVEAGSIATPNGATEVSYCTSNSGNDMLVLELSGNDGDNTAWVITDAAGVITEMPAGFPFNFSGRPAGVCNVYSVTYQNGLSNLTLGSNIANLNGCYDLTNPVVVTKFNGGDCILNCDEITGGCVDISARVSYTSEQCNEGLVSITTDICNDGTVQASDIEVLTAYTNAFKNIQNINVPSGVSYQQEDGAISWFVSSLVGGSCVTMNFDLITGSSVSPYEVVTYITSIEETDADSTPGAVQDSDEDRSILDELSGEDDEAGIEVILDGCIESFVWFDENRNGVSDTDELPMADVQVCLYEIVSNQLVAVDCNTTGSTGKFSFCNLSAGEYRVLFPTAVSTDDVEYILTTPNAMGTDQEVGVDSDAYAESGFTLSYNLGYGRCEDRVGAGYVNVETCTIIGGTVAFAEGTYEVTYCIDDGEADTPQFTPVNATGTHNAWVVTDTDNVILTYNLDNNVFNFEGFAGGTCYIYRVSYDDDIIGLETGEDLFELQGCFVISNPMTVNKQTGSNCPGSCVPAQTCVSGSLWIDSNENEVRDAGDQVLVDIPVCLYRVENNMLISHSCKPTNSSGAYSFCNLSTGDYVIGTPTNVLIDDVQHMIGDPNDDSQTYPSTGFTSTFTLDSEQCNMAISSGYRAKDQNVCDVNGGEIFINNNVVEVIVCVSDGISDLISLSLQGTEGRNQAWTVSNGSGTILSISDSPNFEFEGEDEGVSLIRHISYEDGIEGFGVGESISRLEGCFDLSNVFIVNKLAGNNCTLYDGPDTDTDAAAEGDKANISGKVSTQYDREIQDAEMSIRTDGMEKKNMTDQSGEYAFSSLDMYKDYYVLPHKNDDLLNGVSVIDIVIIQRHILGLDIITSPYDLIAADINNSQSISATDLVTLRKVILGVMDEFPNNTSWRFIDSAFEFADPTTPWSFADDMMLEDLSDNYNDVDFIGVKVGDLNSNVELGSQANLTSSREADTKVLKYKDKALTKGTEISIPVYVTENMKTLGLQFTLDLADGVNFLHVGAGRQEMRDIHFAHVGDNQVTISWSNYEAATVAKDQAVFSIKLWVDKDMNISDAIELTSRVTPALMYGEYYDEYNLSLEPGDKEVNQFELYQNKPNPFDNTTEINFSVARADNAFLIVKNVYGQTLYSKEVSCQEGKNNIIVSANDLQGGSGLLYYSLTVGKVQKTGTMVFVK